MVDEKLILETKAEIKKAKKEERILCEGECSQYFHFLLEGELSVFNYSDDGKEFLQHKVKEGNFFGEPAVLLEKSFPGSVEVDSEMAKILKIKRENFINYLMKNPEKLLEFTKSVAEKALRGSQSIKSIVFLNPEDRILSQLNEYKSSLENPTEVVLIPFTRKEISNMTGLRIETIIRTIKKMEKEKKLTIKNGKVYY
ncbi:MAG: Crp/Fnr family transcriptional regulator [Bacteroidetes bacterium]|jgi:CRP-like cAMP-binding protein|nr:Crp/Fnr family transcriptional regulator [Bacteroidota bacterium]